MNLVSPAVNDFLLFMLAPALCAVFRLTFILFYKKNKSPIGELKKWRECFRYGFWWGMDVNAYLFLWNFTLSFIFYVMNSVFNIGVFTLENLNGAKTLLTLFYLTVLYTAFIGKMIFYFHFHDIYNPTLWLGGNADKKNLADIFFRQNHGGLILLSYVPFIFVMYIIVGFLLNININVMNPPTIVTVLAAVALFYFFRFGGTFLHRNKPEWDEVPRIVKDDVFMAKATIDDLVNLKLLKKRRLPEALKHTDTESVKIIQKLFNEDSNIYLPNIVMNDAGINPLKYFKRTTEGSLITPPKNIFLIIAESYGEAPLDDIYSNLNMAPYGKKLRLEKGAVSFKHTLPGGLISQTSLVSLISGIFDCRMELNEKQAFWNKTPITSLPLQLKNNGVDAEFFYGGSLSWGSLMHYLPASGFSKVYDGIKISPENAGRTWLGVYDHIFLESAAKIIEQNKSKGKTLHILYTTSNHGPYRLPLEDYGFDKNEVFKDIPKELKNDDAQIRKMGAFWYQDKAIYEFIERMRNYDPNALFIVTGDHTVGLIPYGKGVARVEPTIRERLVTSLLLLHPELEKSMFPSNVVTHMNLQATLAELLTPKNTEYFSLYPSLFKKINTVITPFAALTEDAITHYEEGITEKLTDGKNNIFPEQTKHKPFMDKRDALAELTYMTMRHDEFLL